MTTPEEMAFLLSEKFDSTANHVEWMAPIIADYTREIRAQERERCAQMVESMVDDKGRPSRIANVQFVSACIRALPDEPEE